MNRDFYDNKLVSDHLNDTSTYTKVAENADNITAKQSNELVNKHEKCLTYKEKEYITKYDWTTSEFYIRPKIHKCKTVLDEIKREPSKIIEINGAPDLVGRPIIAGTNSPTRHLSDVIVKILTPLVQMQTTYNQSINQSIIFSHYIIYTKYNVIYSKSILYQQKKYNNE